MRRSLALLALVIAGILAWPSAASADEGDGSELMIDSLFIGQQSALVIEVVTDEGATVEVDPAAASWNRVEVVRIGAIETRPAPEAGRTVHRIELAVAPFLPGEQQFAPAVNVIFDGVVTARALPALSWTVNPTLPANAPLELTPLTPPASIGGAESPFLRPGIAAAGVLAVVLAFLTGTAFVRWWRRRPRPEPAPLPVLVAPVVADLSSAEALIDRDPVAAYRSLSSTVRGALSRHYGFPAQAMTTTELERRMGGLGVDGWHARLVRGLLEECDAVVYAGYRPAAERRRADLTMAQEIVEAVA